MGKIFKKLFIGAFCLLAVVGLTGCNTEGLSSDQIDTLVTTLEKSQTFMSNVNDSLDDQINQDKEYVKELKRQNDLKEEELNQVTLDKVWNLHKLAQIRRRARDNEVFSNTKTSIFYNGEHEYNDYSYFTEDGTEVDLVVYASGDNAGELEYIVYSLDEDYKVEGGLDYLRKRLGIVGVGEQTTLLGYDMFTVEDIVDYKLLEDGNYLIQFAVIKEEEYTIESGNTYKDIDSIVAYEIISSDGKLIEENIERVHNSYMLGSGYNTILAYKESAKYVYEYGVVRESDVLPYLTEAQEAYAASLEE